MEGRRRSWAGLLACCIALAISLVHAEGEAPFAARPWMGVFLGDETDGGVRLVAVVPGGPAQKAGIRRGDILIQAHELQVLRSEDLRRALEPLRPGHSVELKLVRSGEVLPVVVELAPYPGTPRPDPALALPAPPSPPAARPRLLGCRQYGLSVTEITPDLRVHFGSTSEGGLLVVGIDPGGTAARDGFRVGDLLVSVGEQTVYRPGDVERWLGRPGPEEIAASVIRDHVPTRLSIRRTPSSSSFPLEPDPPLPPESYESAVRQEIERLNRRIDELKQDLEALQADR